MTKTWTSDTKDVQRAVKYIVVLAICVLALSALVYSGNNKISFVESLSRPSVYVSILALISIAFMPIYFYLNRAPKSITVDKAKNNFLIKKKNETLNFDLSKIKIYQKKLAFVIVLEFFHLNSTENQKEVFATSIIAPNKGFSWNKKIMEEIITELKNQGIEVGVKSSSSDGGDFYVDI